MVKGKDLVGACTLRSMYDMDSIRIIDINKQEYRITATQILEVLKKHDFKQVKARKHFYLTLA